MCYCLAALAANSVCTVFLCLYMLYAATILLFVMCVFAGFFGGLAVYDGLRQLGLQI
jgi:hypothetical protein